MSFIRKLKNNATFNKAVNKLMAIASAIAISIVTAVCHVVTVAKKAIKKCFNENSQKG